MTPNTRSIRDFTISQKLVGSMLGPLLVILKGISRTSRRTGPQLERLLSRYSKSKISKSHQIHTGYDSITG